MLERVCKEVQKQAKLYQESVRDQVRAHGLMGLWASIRAQAAASLKQGSAATPASLPDLLASHPSGAPQAELEDTAGMALRTL